MENKELANLRYEDLKSNNKYNILAFGIYSAFLIVSEWFHYHATKTEIFYPILLSFLLMSALVVIDHIYTWEKGDERIKYVIASAAVITYFGVMLLGHEDFRFVMMFPLLCTMIMYHDNRIISVMSISSLILNVMNVLMCVYLFKRVGANDTSRYIIQTGTVFMASIGSLFASRVYSDSVKKTEIQNVELKNMTTQTIETIANTLDAKDSYTQGHSRRVANYSAHIAEGMGYTPEQISQIHYIALLHDIGKISVPDSVLNKPTRLTEEEYVLMKSHTEAGGEILKDVITIPDIALGAKYHHERYDGKGYPEGLKGDEIPLTARIICLADAFDAMTSNRVYRKQLPLSSVLADIERNKGTQFDPVCVDSFLSYINKVGEEKLFADAGNIRNAFSDEDIEHAQKSMGISAADLDPLTMVYNRSAGEDRIRASMSKNKGAVAIFSIVELHEINMQYGFKRGDYCIQAMAEILLKTEGELLAARFEGNEIVVFIPGITDRESASAWMQNYCDRVGERRKGDRRLDGIMWVVSAITVHDKFNKDITHHLRGLEKAVYPVKRDKHASFIYYDPDITENVPTHRQDEIMEILDIIKNKDVEAASFIKGDVNFLKEVDELKNKGNVAVMLYNVSPVFGESVSPETRIEAMLLLEEAITSTIGGYNQMFEYSSLQRLVLLNVPDILDEARDYLIRTENRIMAYFHKRYGKNDIDVSYINKIIMD